MWRFYLVLAVFMGPTLYGEPELKGTPRELKSFLHPDPNTVTLQGKATETVYADTAHVSLVVTTEDKQLARALELNSRLRDRLTRSFTEAGIEVDDIKSSKFSTSPQYGWFGSKPTSYEVVNRMKITVHSEALMTLLAKAADQNKEVVFGATEFEYSDKKALQTSLKALALADARTQQEQLENALGLKLKPIGVINPVVYDRPSRAASGFLEEAVVTAKSRDLSYAKPEQTLPPSFDELEFEASVNIVYEVSAQ